MNRFRVVVLANLAMLAGCNEPISPPSAPARGLQLGTQVFSLTPGAAGIASERQLGFSTPQPEWFRLTVDRSKETGELHYHITFVPGPPTAEDHAFLSGGVPCMTSKKLVTALSGCVVDAGNREGERGFIILNPNFDDGRPHWFPLSALGLDSEP